MKSQPIVELVLLFLSLACIAYRNKPAVMFLIFFGATADVLAITSFGPNIPFPRVIGVFLIPLVIGDTMRAARRHAAVRLILVYLVWLTVIGVWFGYVHPWPDLSAMRLWSQRSEGRAAVSVGRHLVDFALLVFILTQARDEKALRGAIAGLFAGVSLNVLCSLADLTIGSRIVNFLLSTPVDFLPRQAGLNVEPRSLGRICAFALFVALVFPSRSRLKRGIAVGTALIGLALSASTSALVALSVSSAVCLVVALSQRDLAFLRRLSAATAVMALAAFCWWSADVGGEFDSRIGGLADPEDAAWGESQWTARLEVFDRAAVLFMLDNPIYTVLGTGPDLVSLPASEYVAGVARGIYGDRIDSVPHTGFISVLANAGIGGLFAWTLIIRSLLRHVRASAPPMRNPMLYLTVIMIPFTLMVMTPFWWFTIGLALGACPGATANVLVPVPQRPCWSDADSRYAHA